MKSASKSGGKAKRKRPAPRKKRSVVIPWRAVFLALGSLALGASLVVLGLILLGPKRGPAPVRPHHRVAQQHVAPPHPIEKKHRPAARPPLPFEEHLSDHDGLSRELAVVPEVRGKAVPPTAPAPQPEVKPGPRMVIVIDDLGDHPIFAKKLTELPFPVTMAILPNRPRTRYVAALAAKRGFETILHQPMQPISYPRVNPGPGAVFTDMGAARVKRLLTANLAQLPAVVGINNHMGSAFTASAPGMAAVMQVLRAKGLFFLDSVTSAKSVAPEAARAAGVPLYRRAVFLDNVRTVRAILGQIRLAERLAKKRGHAIAIGHPYGETLEALRLWFKEHDPRVNLVTLTRLGPEPR